MRQYVKEAPRLNEKKLRSWIRQVMSSYTTWKYSTDKDVIQWVEPSMGSTIGLPDMLLKVGKSRIPVELKSWYYRKNQKLIVKSKRRDGRKIIKKMLPEENRVVAKMRPAQVRYHILSSRRGEKTAIMFSCHIQGIIHWEVYVIAGKHCPMGDEKIDMSKAVQVGSLRDLQGGDDSIKASRLKIIKTLSSPSFWE